MLDIYTIPDADERWEEPREECKVGSLALEEHKALERLLEDLRLEDNKLSFFEDTRLTSASVGAALRRLEALTSSGGYREGTLVTKLRGILEAAASQGLGLMAFAD